MHLAEAPIAFRDRRKIWLMNIGLRKAIGWAACGIVILVLISAWLEAQRGGDVRQAAADCRRALRAQGFKTDLADFPFTNDAAMQARVAALMVFYDRMAGKSHCDELDQQPFASNDTATVAWKQDALTHNSRTLQWSELRVALARFQWELDNACDAALSGPIRLDFQECGIRTNLYGGGGFDLYDYHRMVNLAHMLGGRTLLDLHDGLLEAAWTNLLAMTRLVSAWDPGPVEFSHYDRFRCARLAESATWQALQTNGWPDEGLARLQHEWESVNYFSNLPATAAFDGAYSVAFNRQLREDPFILHLSPPSEILHEAVSSPLRALSELHGKWDIARFRGYGSYVLEEKMLLYCRDRELELRNAVQAANWPQMRRLPGVTNLIVVDPPHFSPTMRDIFGGLPVVLPFPRQGSDLLISAANYEARRRVIITALALARYRGKHGAYPRTLSPLAPEFLQAVPLDFMTGRPLPYQLRGNGHIVLHSVDVDWNR